MTQTFAEKLVADTKAKFKRPTVIRALLGLPKTASNDSSVSGVMRGERRLPEKWVARFAEINDIDPIEAMTRYKAETPSAYAEEDIQKALDQYPLHRSKALKIKPLR